MTTDDPLCIPVDPHDYEHADEPEPDDEFVSLAGFATKKQRTYVRAEDELVEHPGD
jgi:hypothetical protein